METPPVIYVNVYWDKALKRQVLGVRFYKRYYADQFISVDIVPGRRFVCAYRLVIKRKPL